MKRTLMTLGTLAFVLTACSGGDADGPLVVYSGRAEELVQPLIDQFEEESGIDVDVRYAGSTDLAATLLQEGESTDADVFYAQDPASLGSVSTLMEPLSEDILGMVDPSFSDSEGRWVGTSGRVRVFVYNTGTDLPLPETIDDVNDPAWAGQIGVAPTNGSFLAFVSAMILERGEEATLTWLQGLAANEPVIFEGNAPIVDATDSGEIQGGLVNHYYLLRLRAEGGGADAENWYIPAGDVGSLVMPAGAAITSGTDMPEAAEEFVAFLLSESAQHYFADEVFEFPVIEGIDLGEGTPSLDEIASPDIDLSQLADVLDDATRLVTEAGLV
ncbi:MAG TPA: extracellular solute-binding protein [Acidimicrobiia bacterium]